MRIRSILSELDASGLFEKLPAKRYSDRHIRSVHDGRLVDYIRKACLMAGPKKSIYPYVFPTRNPARPPKDETVLAGYYCIDTFTPLNQNAYLAARSAVDCALTAAEKVLEGTDLAYALVRPPGHHAETRTFGGFCYFNNGAIAANLLSRYGRVAILDIDYHHGNGQQEIFYNRADVLTVSIYGHPSFAYPYFSGFRDETGTGAGAGYNLNIPLPEHITPEQHRNAVAEGLRRIRRFSPAFLVLSLGFDTGRGDPTGTWPNRAKDFEQLGRMVGEQGYSTLVVQEGGYRVRTLGANARSFFNGLVTGHASARQMAPSLNRGAGLARTGQQRNGLEWRSAVMADDVGRVRSLVASTGFFNPAEVEVAADLVTERLTKGIRSGYNFVLAERGSVAGRLCLLWTDRGDARLLRAVLDRGVARRAEARARRPGLCPRRGGDAQSGRQAHLRRYLLVRPLCRHARLLSAHGLSRGCAACRFLRAGRRQDRLCETAEWRSAPEFRPWKVGRVQPGTGFDNGEA